MSRGMPIYGGNIKKPTASIQIKKAGDANGLEINDTVTLTITGVVKSVDSPRESIDYGEGGSKSRMMPGCIELEIESMSVEESSGGDDDDDGEDEAD